MQTKNALIVGINHYDFSSPLTGCINDALQMEQLLSCNEQLEGTEYNFHCTTLISGDLPHKKITRSKLFDALKKLLLQPQGGDSAIFFFSGHGYTNSIGGYLVTQETGRFDEGFSVTDLITMANKSKVKEVAIILDCCFSGTAGRLGGLNDEVTLLRKGVSILTATTGEEVALERAGIGGEFTHILREGLKGLAADYFGNVTLPQLYQYASLQCEYGRTEQTPTLKANIDSNFVLRKVRPEIRLDELQELRTYFLHAQTQLRLHERRNDKVFSDSIRNWGEMGILAALHRPSINEEFSIPKGRAVLTQKGQFFYRLQQLNSK